MVRWQHHGRRPGRLCCAAQRFGVIPWQGCWHGLHTGTLSHMKHQGFWLKTFEAWVFPRSEFLATAVDPAGLRNIPWGGITPSGLARLSVPRRLGTGVRHRQGSSFAERVCFFHCTLLISPSRGIWCFRIRWRNWCYKRRKFLFQSCQWQTEPGDTSQ